MKKIGLALGLVVTAIVGCGDAGETAKPAYSVQTTKQNQTVFSGRQLVVFKGSALPGDATARIANAGASIKQTLPAVGIAVVEGSSAALATLAADETVEAVGPELVWKKPTVKKHDGASPTPPPTPSDFLYGAQWDIRHVKAPQAWNNVSLQSQANVTIAVIDSGVMSDHPDLAGQIVDHVSTSISPQLGCPSSPHPDPSYPLYFTRINFANGNLCEPVDDEGSVDTHGTHVAGTIAGNANTGGVVGVAPGAKVAAYKVFDRVVIPTPEGALEIFTAFDEAILGAILDAANKGYPVVNMSLGGMIDREDPLQNASWIAWNRVAGYATRKGTLIIAAAGNDGANNNGSVAFIPSDLPGVVSVSSAGNSEMQGGPFPFGTWDAAGRDVRAFYSNYGAAVNLTAPGGDCGPEFPNACDPRYLILSSIPMYIPGQFFGPGWAWMAGTSMAAPHVAGVAALVKAKNPSFTPAQLRQKLEGTARRLNDRLAFGRGMVDAEAATR